MKLVNRVAKKFGVRFLQVLDENGRFDAKNAPKLSQKELVRLYETMIRSAAFDAKALVLQKQGRIGTYISAKGQEASQVGAAFALTKNDFVFPTYRESAMLIAMGAPIKTVLRYWGGDEQGNRFPEQTRAFPISIPVGTQGLHATGYAMGASIKRKKMGVLACLGDGASSEGDMHEAMNFAGVFRAPVVFFCQNNGYAISVPVEKQTASSTFAQKAIAYGFPGIQVDGNDVLAVYRATSDALSRARAGTGPTLIECLTYRVESHSTSDDESVYRQKSEVEKWRKRDPVERFEKFLFAKKILDAEKAAAIREAAKKEVSKAVGEYEESPKPGIEDMFSHVYAEMPVFLREQLAEMRKHSDKGEK